MFKDGKVHILFCVNKSEFGTKCFVKREQFVLPFITDTATIIHFYAYYIPKYWIQVSTNAQLTDEKGGSYTLKKADGLTPGEHFFLPESGEAEFSLTFEPLPFDTKRFNFTEGTSEKDWQINGIKLTK